MEKMQIGWVGLGNMGTPMAMNLLKAGYLVTVYNRTLSKLEKLLNAGAKKADTPQDVAATCDIIFTMVSDDEAVKQLYSGENGMLKKEIRAGIAIDMSTVSPDTSRYIAELCKEKGIEFMDAPVSGSVKPAQEGTLIIMAGGSEPTFQKVKPLFESLGKLSIHLGPNGAGSSAKLAINYLLGLNLQGMAESVLFAQKNGIDPAHMLTIINESACGNGITKLKTPSILNNDFPAAFALKLLAKDLRLAGEQGISTPLFQPLHDSYQEAVKAGLGEDDCMAIFKYLKVKE